MSARAKAAIWSSPTSRKARAGLRDLQTLYWIGKYLYHVEDAADLVDHGVFTREEYRTFQKAEAFLWNVRVRLHYLLGRAEERLSFDVQPALAAELGYVDAEKPRRAVEAFMRAYFLVAKDVGDLTRIFCAALEEQHKKPRPSLSRILPGFLRPRSPERRFLCREWPAERQSRHLPPGPRQHPAHVPYRRHQGRGHPSRCAAHRDPLAGPDHRRGARKSGGQSAPSWRR